MSVEANTPVTKLFEPHFWKDSNRKLEYYLDKMDGYKMAKKVLTEMTPDQVIDEVKKANLRGRGGAGFPMGMKWSFIPKVDKPKYLVINADESEPGTCKDRQIIRYTPHALIEGIIIGSHAIGCKHSYIYIRGEYAREAKLLQEAIDEAYAKGYLGQNILGTQNTLDITIHRGAGAYICGEETGLLNSLEGKRGEPRVKPPFPAVSGAFACPTAVNNVESVATVPFVMRMGGDNFAKLGKIDKSGGTRLISLSGHVNKPGVYEIGAGSMTLRQIIEDLGGGVWKGRKLKAVVPGGSSAPVLSADEIDVVYDVEPLQKVGTMMGSAAIMVCDDTTDMVKLLLRVTKFYAHESCGQCTPCREGCQWMESILHRIVHHPHDGKAKPSDIDMLTDIAGNIGGKTLCALGDAAAGPVISFIKKFRPEFEAYVRGDVKERVRHA
ncbi:MAG: NADH-quinone oxidoreductase subunit NuoF [Bdellovibrionales bacterium]|nr:NADH-quinone oxidoreductase subunit NuoF [Bdellovibrionales bacterium]